MIHQFSTDKESRQKLRQYTLPIILELMDHNKAHFHQVLMELKK
jgi:hypothetical protein